MVIVFGSDAKNVCRFLEKNGVDSESFAAERVPSLTALLLSRGEITSIVLLQSEEKNWSMGHILAAAQQLKGKGRILFRSPQNKPPALICAVESKEAMLRELRGAGKKAADSSSGGLGKKAETSDSVEKKPVVRPLRIPAGKILFLGVLGTQRRIGCTTQAVGLWHYCKALGFDPAVVSSAEQIAQIAAPMRCEEIANGYRIEGIPFVANTAQSYDCYILDIGPGPIPAALEASDCLILVAGSKPWEIQHTATALKAAKGQTMPVLLSFSSEADANSLRPLFGNQKVAVMPWMPELWQASEVALKKYDGLLRSFLEHFLSRDDQQPEEDMQFAKGE